MGCCCDKQNAEEGMAQLHEEQEMAKLENIAGVSDVLWGISDNGWKAYEDYVGDQIEAMDVGASYQYISRENNQTYKITKLSPTSAQQINVNRGTKPRKVSRLTI